LIREDKTGRPLYVGKTCRCVDKRFKEHISERYSNQKVYNASKRTKLEVIILKRTTEEKVYDEEQKYIKLYKQKFRMYNKT
jgi:predicted RNA-binding protein YlxR (DUF448 family)